MSIRIGSNTAALQSVRRLTLTSNEIGGVYEQLSSGQRINRASDDAAGLAIADRLRANRTLARQATKNINDGMSLINIADGALDQRGSILQRLAELAEQSANGTFASAQRSSLNNEYRELLRELTRLKESTRFNGIDIFGSSTGISLQAGITGSVDSELRLEGLALGNSYWSLDRDSLVDLVDIDGNNGVDGGDLNFFGTINEGATLQELTDLFGSNYIITSVTDEEGNERSVFVGVGRGAEGLSFMSFTLSLDGSAYIGNSRNFQVFAESFQIGGTISTEDVTLPTSPITLSDGLGSDSVLTPDSSRLFTLDNLILRFGDGGPLVQPDAIYASSVDSAGRALSALDLIKDEIASLAQTRGKLGASQGRLSIALALAEVSAENFAAAESRIRDADIATESARLVRLQILQQVGASVLQQAQIQPELALRLLSA